MDDLPRFDELPQQREREQEDEGSQKNHEHQQQLDEQEERVVPVVCQAVLRQLIALFSRAVKESLNSRSPTPCVIFEVPERGVDLPFIENRKPYVDALRQSIEDKGYPIDPEDPSLPYYIVISNLRQKCAPKVQMETQSQQQQQQPSTSRPIVTSFGNNNNNHTNNRKQPSSIPISVLEVSALHHQGREALHKRRATGGITQSVNNIVEAQIGRLLNMSKKT